MKGKLFATVIAISAGLFILVGTLLPFQILVPVRLELLHWAVIISSVAVLVGIANLLGVHLQKVRRREKNSLHSAILILSMSFTLIIGVLFKPNGAWMQMIFEGVIFPVEASLMALLTVTLIYASVRLLRRRTDIMSIVFIGAAALTIFASVSLPLIGEMPLLGDVIRPWLTSTLAAGGARGLLLGVALGALTTGLRVLFAFDRPFGGK
jgi:hypothetical protein